MTAAPFLRATTEALLFLAHSGEEMVNPDVAVAQLELLASILKELDETDRREFRAFVNELAERETLESGCTPRALFLSTLLDNLGIG